VHKYANNKLLIHQVAIKGELVEQLNDLDGGLLVFNTELSGWLNSMLLKSRLIKYHLNKKERTIYGSLFLVSSVENIIR